MGFGKTSPVQGIFEHISAQYMPYILYIYCCLYDVRGRHVTHEYKMFCLLDFLR